MIDIEYLLFLQKIRLASPDVVVQLFEFISNFGTVFSIPILCLIYWCCKKEDGILALWSLGFAMLANGLLKQIMCIYRPWIRDPRIVPPDIALAGATGYSFPSGHSTKAASYLGAIGRQYRKKAVIFYSLFALIILVCFSRNFLGVHTPQDMIVGFTCGILSIPTSWFVLKWEQKEKNRDFVILGVCFLIVAVYLAYINFKNYPLDYDSNGKLLVDPKKMALDSWGHGGIFIGVVLGWLIEKRFVKFQAPSSFLTGICRYVIGIGAILPLKYSKEFFCTLFTDAWGYFTAGFLSFFFVTCLYPAIFTAVENCMVKNNPINEQPRNV